MTALNHVYKTETTQQSTTSATFSDAVESGTLVTGAKYAMFVYAKVNTDSSNKLAHVQMVDKTLEDEPVFTGSGSALESDSTTHYRSYSYVTVFVAQSAGTVALQFKSDDGSTATRVRFASMALIQLNTPNANLIENADWFFVEDTTETTLTDSFADFAEITLTDAYDTASTYSNRIGGDEEWLVFAHSVVDINNVAYQTDMELSYTRNAATVDAPACSQEGEDTSEFVNGWLMRTYTLGGSNAAATWKVRLKDENASAGNKHTSSRLFGLRMGCFEQTTTEWDESALDTTSTSFITNLDGTITPDTTAKVLILGSSVFDAGSTYRQMLQDLDIDGSTLFGTALNGSGCIRSTDATDEIPYQIVAMVDGVASTEIAYDWQFKKAASASYGVEDRAIAVISLEVDKTRRSWEGNFDGTVSDARNWSGLAAPTGSDIALFATDGTNAPDRGTLSCGQIYIGKQFNQDIGLSTGSVNMTADLICADTPAQLYIDPTTPDFRIRKAKDIPEGCILGGKMHRCYVMNCSTEMKIASGATVGNLYILGGSFQQPLLDDRVASTPQVVIADGYTSTGDILCEGRFNIDDYGESGAVSIYGGGRYNLFNSSESSGVGDLVVATNSILYFNAVTVIRTVTVYGGTFTVEDNTNSQLDFGSAIDIFGGTFNLDNGLESANATAFSGTTVTAYRSQTLLGSAITLTPS